MTQRLTAEEFETFRKDLPTSLGYYQATVTMISIFLGFSFAALLQILTIQDHRARTYDVLVTLLVLSLALFMTALVLLALTTHQVFRCWKVFFPLSWLRRIGSLAMSFGMLVMILSVSWLLGHEQMPIRAWLLGIYGVLLTATVLIVQRKLLHDYPHRIDVSGVVPCRPEPPSPKVKPVTAP